MFAKLATGQWYYAQAFATGHYQCERTIIFAGDKKTATAKAKAWAQSKGCNGSIHLYRNNYKRDAANMVAVGNFVA